jgi:uncharacterized protein YbjT (DUF2867 family)
MIAVVGGTGFIGRRLVEQLQSEGHEVVVVTHRAERARTPGYRFGDLCSPETLPDALAGARVVVQSTQFPSYPMAKRRRGLTYMAYDGVGTERLVSAAVRAGVERYVYVSGVGARAPNGRPYFEAIRRAETAVQNSGIEWACLRPAFVYGPRDRGINGILAAAQSLPVVPLVGGYAEHQPVYVDDLAGVLARLVGDRTTSGIYELGGPERMTLREMVARAFQITGTVPRIVPIPNSMARLGAHVLEVLPGELLCRSAIDFICEDFIADNRRVLGELAFELTRLEVGLASYLKKKADSGQRRRWPIPSG